MKTVLIIGGGYGGIRALEVFSRYNEAALKIILIDQHTYHYLQTESYNLLVSNISLEKAFVYLPTLVASFGNNFSFLCEEALRIEGETLVCSQARLHFDYLIIATGSVTKFLQNFYAKSSYVLGVKSLRAALHAKQYFEEELFDRLEGCIKQKTFTIVVIGGGLSGVELAAEMREYCNRYSKENALSCGTIHIKLITRHILKGQKEAVIARVTSRLKTIGVDIIEHRVDRVEERQVVLDNAQTLAFDFAMVTGGIAPSAFLENLSVAKNAKGFLEVDSYLRVQENIFAVGDAAVLYDIDGNPLPPTAQSAEASGTIAATNILASIERRPLRRANIKLRGLAIALGGKNAVVLTPFGVVIHGYAGWLIKQAIEKTYKIALKRKAAKGYGMLRSC